MSSRLFLIILFLFQACAHVQYRTPGAVAIQDCASLFSESFTFEPPPYEDPQLNVWYFRLKGNHTQEKAELDRIEEILKPENIVGYIALASEGVSESYLVSFKGGYRALFKPRQTRNSPESEIAAAIIDEAFDFFLVPKTIAGKMKIRKGFIFSVEREGTFQFWIEDAVPARAIPLQVREGPYGANLTIFDFLIGQSPGERQDNFLSKAGKLIAIDHGLAFISKRYLLDDAEFEFAKKLPERTKSKILKFSENEKKLLREKLKPLLTAVALDLFFLRLESLQDFLRGGIPESE